MDLFLDLLWDKGYTLIYKEKVRCAIMTGADNITLRQGMGFMDEALEQILSLTGQVHINCTFDKQLAEDHLANMDLLLCIAEATLKVGMERASFAALLEKVIYLSVLTRRQ